MGLLIRIAILRDSRRGEVCVLRWSVWDDERGIFAVEGTLLQLGCRLMPKESPKGSDYVFTRPEGRPWNPDHVTKRFKRLCTAAGVPMIKFH